MPWRNTQRQWGGLAILFHWLSAVTIFALFALGLWMVGLDYYHGWYHKAPAVHKGIGILLFAVTLLRLGWRLGNPTPAPLPSHSPFERNAAHWVHVMLYLLLLFTMLSGYLISTADGRAIEVFGWFKVPATLQGIDKQEDMAGVVHLWLAGSVIALTCLHAAAALWHHFLHKDRTLLRILGLNR